MDPQTVGRGAIEKLFVGTSNRHQESPGAASWGSRDDNDEGQASSGLRKQDPRYFFALAPDEDEESTCSSSVYDSIHNRETDFCRDSDDYSSDASTASDATSPNAREVIEFDVVTASSDDGEYLYLEDSSSGTDNYIIDKRILVLQETRLDPTAAKDESTSSTGGGSSSSSSGNASEDSAEDSTDEDPELRPADYWKCVKCHNSQNNPLYRYCEKCYQLRKNYFPPRPKISKTRPKKNTPASGGGHNHHHHHHEQSSTDCVTSGEEDEDTEKRTRKRTKTSDRSITKCTGNTITQGDSPTAALALTTSGSVVLSVEDEEGEGKKAGGEGGASGRSVQLVSSSVVGSAESNLKILKRSNSSQSTDEGDESVSACKKQKVTSSDEGCSGVGESQEEMRPKNLNLAAVLIRGFADSGCSSYSSGHESIPSPVDNCIGGPGGGDGDLVKCLEVGGHSQADSLLGDAQMTVSLSRDFHHGPGDKASSYSDSETYRRTSSKCVVNCGKANAIVRRIQGELLGGSQGGNVVGAVEEPRKAEGEGLKTSKSMLEQYAEQKEEEDRMNNLCIICVNAPKDSAFVHTRTVHISCCYRCAIKVWNKKKRCPICNCKVKNVLKCYVH